MTEKETYKKELLDKYLRKEISNDERHELEKLALDDPFLFEALNGFAQAEGEHAIDVSILRGKILATPEKRKVRSLVIKGIAASLLVVVGMSLWLSDIGMRDMARPEMAGVNHAAKSTQANERAEVAEVLVEESVEMEAGDSGVSERASSQTDVKEVEKDININANDQITLTEEEAVDFQSEPKTSSTYVVDGVAVKNMPAAKKRIEEQIAELDDSDLSTESVLVESVEVAKEKMPSEGDAEKMGDASVYTIKNKRESDLAEANTKTERAIDKMSSKSAEANMGYLPENTEANSFVDPFDGHFQKVAKEQFTRKELRALDKKVTLEFKITDGAISNFNVNPSQDERINGMLLSIVKSGSELLQNQNEELVVYAITFL